MKHLSLLLASTVALYAASINTQLNSQEHSPHEQGNLSEAQMEAASGAGSTCRWGCNEDDVTCTVEWVIPQIGQPFIVRIWRQEWSPHWECAWAWGSDTCIPLPGGDVLCNTIFEYPPSSGNCNGTPSNTITTLTSICSTLPPPNPD
jgi:hypothetical protein